MDFTADGRYLAASCEFSGQVVIVSVAGEQVVRTIDLPDGPSAMPQDVKLSPDGAIFYVADMRAGGVWEIDARTFRVLRLLHTGVGAHGLYPSRDSKLLYVTNRGEGSISVIRFSTRKVVAKWHIPGGGSPDMGGVSANGKVLWLSGRYSGVVYAISTRTGRLLARIPRGLRTARAERLATAGALLARPHRHPALAMKRVAAGTLAALLLAVAAAGCGGGAGASQVAALRRGSTIFADSCSSCHTLAGRESGASGGDLVEAHLSVAALVSFTEAMPARRPLTHAEVLAVAEFVHQVAGR